MVSRYCGGFRNKGRKEPLYVDPKLLVGLVKFISFWRVSELLVWSSEMVLYTDKSKYERSNVLCKIGNVSFKRSYKKIFLSNLFFRFINFLSDFEI